MKRARRAPSPRKLSVDDLCAKYGNEEVHANQVMTLALDLFDATRGLVGAPAEDRPLLSAACRLHEIGYAINPRRHAQMGCEVVLREGLNGFTPAQRADIAAAIFLHPARLDGDGAQSLVRRLPDGRRALRLAAYLRVADGLDHWHLQDAAIIAVQEDRQKVHASIHCSRCPTNIEFARQKADVWRAAFPLGLRLTPAARKSLPTTALVGPEQSPAEAARRLLLVHLRMFVDGVDGALAAKNSEALHGVRVAIRRMRTVLRVFRKPLVTTSASRIDRKMQDLNAALGEARDLDVLIDHLTTGDLRALSGRHPRWARFIDYQRELRRLQQATVERHLRGASFAALRLRISRMLRVEIPQLVKTQSPDTLAALGRRALAKSLRRCLKLARLRYADSPEKLHQLRITLRRTRHIGGMFCDVLGPPIDRLTGRVHRVEEALGRMRDVDLAFSRSQREGPSPPRLLVAQLKRQRGTAEAELRGAWSRLTKPRFLRAVRRQLKK